MKQAQSSTEQVYQTQLRLAVMNIEDKPDENEGKQIMEGDKKDNFCDYNMNEGTNESFENASTGVALTESIRMRLLKGAKTNKGAAIY